MINLDDDDDMSSFFKSSDDLFSGVVNAMKRNLIDQLTVGSDEDDDQMNNVVAQTKENINIINKDHSDASIAAKNEPVSKRTRRDKKISVSRSSNDRRDDDMDLTIVRTTKRKGRKRNKPAKKHVENVPVEGPIVIDSDEDVSLDINVMDESSKEIYNHEISVKVIWHCKDIHTFYLRKHEKLNQIFDYFATLEKIPKENVLVSLGNKVVHPEDTPSDLGLTVVDFLEGGVIVNNSPSDNTNGSYNKSSKDDIELKVQIKDRKKPIIINLKKNDSMEHLMVKCSEKLEVNRDKLKFSFDGEMLNSDDTPEDLDLEGGECIDVIVLP